MSNELTYTVKCSRLQVIDLVMAVHGIIFDFWNEMKDPATNEERRKICKNSIDHRWQPLADLIEAQLDAQDAKHPIE